jgi:hypothetical protein
MKHSTSKPGQSIRERARSAHPDELANIPWLNALTSSERQRAAAALVVSEAMPGDLLCRVGRATTTPTAPQ